MSTRLRATAAFAGIAIVLLGLAKVGIDVLIGTVVQVKTYPWHVAVMVSEAYKCGGAHIGGGWVLTAKHCVDKAVEIQIVANRNSINGNPPLLGNCATYGPPGRAPCRRMAPLWDLALVQLGPSVANSVKTIALPRPGDLPANTETYIVGWGNTLFNDKIWPGLANLRGVKLKISSNSSCASAQLEVPKPALCARGAYDGLCKGDSGGALVKAGAAPGEIVLEGIASQAETCTAKLPLQPVRYATFVDISNADVLTWIRDQREASYEQPPTGQP